MNHKAAAAVGVTAVLVTAGTLKLWTELEGGPHLVPYQDVAGVWTVCRGHTGPDVIPGVAWTREQCDRKDWENLNHYGLVVVRCTNNAPLTRGQRDALIVFAGNVGEGAFCASTLAAFVKAGSYPQAPDQFKRWVFHSCRSMLGCQYEEGLFNRRVKEVARWNLPGEPAVYKEG